MQLQNFFTVKYLMGLSIDVKPYRVLFWNAFAVFSFTFVVSYISFACLMLQNTVKFSCLFPEPQHLCSIRLH